jgi:uncharacterized protein (DUF2267 family)
MSAPLPAPAQPDGNRGSGRRLRTTGGATLGRDSERDTRRLAAAVLEVLAGARTPTEAATALAVSLPRYYQLETQALKGLLAACAPKPRGRVRSADRDLARLRQDNQRLQREVTRQQTLLRAAQRTVGLAAPAPPPPVKKPGQKTRKRRVARALSVAAHLHAQDEAMAAAPEAMIAE